MRRKIYNLTEPVRQKCVEKLSIITTGIIAFATSRGIVSATDLFAASETASATGTDVLVNTYIKLFPIIFIIGLLMFFIAPLNEKHQGMVVNGIKISCVVFVLMLFAKAGLISNTLTVVAGWFGA